MIENISNSKDDCETDSSEYTDGEKEMDNNGIFHLTSLQILKCFIE